MNCLSIPNIMCNAIMVERAECSESRQNITGISTVRVLCVVSILIIVNLLSEVSDVIMVHVVSDVIMMSL